MKKVFSIIAALVLCCSTFALLSACSKQQNNPEKNYVTTKLELSYMRDLKIDMTGKQGFAIKKAACSSQATPQSIDFVNFNLAPAAANDLPKSKNKLFVTTQSYDYGDIVYDENSIKEVTFIKNEKVTEEVYDANGNLITTETELTQDEIPGQINKLYVCGRYTFMQFVPVVSDYKHLCYYNAERETYVLENPDIMRPDSLTYDVNGIAEFDRKYYYHSPLKQNFVIDNNTGYIYKIEDFDIDEISSTGILSQRAWHDATQSYETDYYKMYVENGNLVFLDIVPNKNLTVYNIVQDKYGWIFVNNNSLDEIDTENKIIYYQYSTHPYLIDEDLQMYLFKYDDEFQYRMSIKSIVVDGVAQDVDLDNFTAYGFKYLDKDFVLNNAKSAIYGYYQGKRIYNDASTHSYYSVETQVSGYTLVEDSIIVDSYPEKYFWFNAKNSYMIWNRDGYLYYQNFDFANYLGTETILGVSDFVQISNAVLHEVDEYYLAIGNDRKAIEHVYRKETASSTTYYQLVVTDNGLDLVELENQNYNQNLFIFQPINK